MTAKVCIYGGRWSCSLTLLDEEHTNPLTGQQVRQLLQDPASGCYWRWDSAGGAIGPYDTLEECRTEFLADPLSFEEYEP